MSNINSIRNGFATVLTMAFGYRFPLSAYIQASAQKNEHLMWEVDALRVELQDAEHRSKGWLEVHI